MMYENGWGRVFGSVYETRSDGALTCVTHKYAANCVTLNLYVMNTDNYSRLRSGEKFEFYHSLSDAGYGKLALDLPEDEPTYMVFQNSHANNFQHAAASVKLYRAHSNEFSKLNLVQNAPNPANNRTVIRNQLP